jgi:hypothetical protein
MDVTVALVIIIIIIVVTTVVDAIVIFYCWFLASPFSCLSNYFISLIKILARKVVISIHYFLVFIFATLCKKIASIVLSHHH